MELVPLSKELVELRDDEREYGEDSLSDVMSDVVTQMPDDWPNIRQLLIRHSWDFTTAIHPSVNKAMSRLDLLQTVLIGWQKSAGADERLSLHSTESCGDSATFNPDTALCVFGVGQVPKPAMSLGTEYVVEETITLLARLEKDRQDTLEGLRSERDRVKMLGRKIENLAADRMVCLPLAVQREHEACSNDINELKWHVTYGNRSVARLKNRVDKAQTINSNMKEEMASNKTHIPLIEEKLVLENEAMKQIDSEQTETDAVLKSGLEKLAKTMEKSDATFAKAEQERATMRSDIEAAQNNLTSVITQLQNEQSLYDTYVKNSESYAETITKYNVELPFEIQRNSKEKERERKQKEKVMDMEMKLTDAEKSFDVLKSLQRQLEADLDFLNESFSVEEKSLSAEVDEKDESTRLLKRKNRELEMEVDIRSRKIKNCEEKKLADERNMERMKNDIENTIVMLDSIEKELESVTEDHRKATEKLEKENRKCQAEEDAQKSTVDLLKKTVKDELHRKTILKARIESDGKEFLRIQQDSKTRIETSEKRVLEVKKATSEITAKVEALDTEYRETEQAVEFLKGSLLENESRKQEAIVNSDSSMQELLPERESRKSELSKLEEERQEMVAKSDEMTKEIEGMDTASILIVKSHDTATATVNRLQDELEELKLQLISAERLKTSILKSLSDVTTRDLSLETKHREVMLSRQSVHQNLEAELNDSKSLNKMLAATYRQLQNELIRKKTEFARTLEDRIKLENDIKDLKQMLCVQSRLHAALQHYYKYRHLCSDSELTQVRVESKNSSARVNELHWELDAAVVKITDFIQDQMQTGAQTLPNISNGASKIDCFHGPALPRITTTAVVG